MTNGVGKGAMRVNDLAIYDSLPPIVREMLANAPSNIGAESVMKLFFRYDPSEIDGAMLFPMIKAACKRDAKRLWPTPNPSAEILSENDLRYGARSQTRRIARSQRRYTVSSFAGIRQKASTAHHTTRRITAVQGGGPSHTGRNIHRQKSAADDAATQG